MNKILRLSVVMLLLVFTSCSNDDTSELDVTNKNKQVKLAEFTNATHKLIVFSDDGNLYQGYNSLSVVIKDKSDKELNVEKVRFHPSMRMKMDKMSFKHSCPHSIELNKEGNLFKGYSLFQMKTSMMGFWQFNFTYTIDGKEYVIENEKVKVNEKKGKYSSFVKFSDIKGEKYYIAIVNHNPIMGANEDVKFMFVKVKGTGEVTNGIKDLKFVIANDYKIELDPRMSGPEMGNHTSDGNIHPNYNREDDLFHATIGYSMGGNWTLNFIIKNNRGEIIGGSKVNCDLSGDHTNCDVNSKSEVALEVDVPN